jgi:hypothetical protein
LDIAAGEYLDSEGKLSGKKLNDIRQFMKLGYEKILEKRNRDYSFSLRGETGNARIWLTAYVLKLLNVAQNYIPVDFKHISFALNYIADQQELYRFNQNQHGTSNVEHF